jgi:hypothetical protein
MAMSNEPTVVELTFEGDDRVFFSTTNVHTMAEEDQAAAAYLESYDGPGIPVRLDPGLTMAMFKGGAPIDHFWHTFESRPSALMLSKHSSRL